MGMIMFKLFLRRGAIVCCACLFGLFFWNGVAFAVDAPELTSRERLTLSESLGDLTNKDRWSLHLGVGAILDDSIDRIATGDISRAEGQEGEGDMYLIGATYTLHEFDWQVGDSVFHPQLNLPMVLTIFDEEEKGTFFGYNAGLTLRWRDFPWNSFLYTNFETGLGLTYTERVTEYERQRHPDRDRSHLKFYWPIELAFALPAYPQHQLTLFIHHHSGGHIFDVGGTNVIGLGYRYSFGAPLD